MVKGTETEPGWRARKSRQISSLESDDKKQKSAPQELLISGG